MLFRSIGGEIVFDETYAGNPLVNALCVGVMRHEDIKLAKAHGVGNLVVLFGAKTGGDGIGGVSVLASETFNEEKPTKRPSVQVGDPFQEKLLLEATMELAETNAIVGMQDMGAAGITCSTCEMSAGGGVGMDIYLDKVPTRQENMLPYEILLSESQERMLVVVKKGEEAVVKSIFDKWDLHAEEIGVVTDTGRVRYHMHGEIVGDVPAESLVLGGGGFIGSHLVKRLKKEGYWVRVVDLKYPEFAQTEADSFIKGDLRLQTVCDEAFDQSFDEIGRAHV